MLRAFDNCTPECDFKHLIFLFSYSKQNLDKNLVLGCRFFSDFSRIRLGSGNWRLTRFFEQPIDLPDRPP